jgi:hypothetical protein
MWIEMFKSPIVTRTNRVGRIVTRTKRGWTKRQGTTALRQWSSEPALSHCDSGALKQSGSGTMG